MKKLLNSLSARILIVVIGGMVLATAVIGSMIIHISEKIFIDTYGKAQDKVFTQVEDNLNAYFENLSSVMKEMDASISFRYLFHDVKTEEEMHSIEHFNAIYRLKKDMETVVTKYMPEQKILIVGENGATYMNHSEALGVSKEMILEDTITKQAAENPDALQFFFREGGFLQSTSNMDVIIGVKAFYRKDESKPYAYAYVTLTESDMKGYYNFFVTDTNDFYMLDQQDKIILTNRSAQRGTIAQATWLQRMKKEDTVAIIQQDNQMLTVFHRELPYFHFQMYGVIDNNRALGSMYETKRIVLYCILIVLVVVLLVILMVRRFMRPLQLMSKKMQKIKNGNFNEYMEPKGSNEIVELANTYNYMLDDLKLYVDALMQTQKEKRKAEIHALQMQINPHYVYNTLASIKWLIFQGDMEKSTKTIDAFIYLLRNTISDTKEFITVAQEIENLKNYVWIQKTRYGEQIKTEFYVLQECEADLLPKMILQPFVENAFFHGFPSGQQGMIQVYFKEDDTHLIMSVQDNGIGMTEHEMHKIDAKKNEKFSGIGVKNIKERLSLLYGKSASMQIQSKKGEGTTVLIRIPIAKQMKEKASSLD